MIYFLTTGFTNFYWYLGVVELSSLTTEMVILCFLVKSVLYIVAVKTLVQISESRKWKIVLWSNIKWNKGLLHKLQYLFSECTRTNTNKKTLLSCNPPCKSFHSTSKPIWRLTILALIAEACTNNRTCQTVEQEKLKRKCY